MVTKTLIRKTGTQFVYKVKAETDKTKTNFKITKAPEVIEPPVVIEKTECSKGFDINTTYCYNINEEGKHEAYVFCDYVE